MTSQQYSEYITDKNGDLMIDDNEEIMSAVVATIARVNGLYLSEVGVFFELIEDTDMLFCPKDPTATHSPTPGPTPDVRRRDEGRAWHSEYTNYEDNDLSIDGGKKRGHLVRGLEARNNNQGGSGGTAKRNLGKSKNSRESSESSESSESPESPESGNACTDQFGETDFELIENFFEKKTITDDLYDIGHVFQRYDIESSFGGEGRGTINSLCNDGKKHAAYTGIREPDDIEEMALLVAHELGHQLGAHHTFRECSTSLADGGFDEPAANEPGSGSTIMSYQGICGNNNLKREMDVWFNSISINDMRSYVSYVVTNVGIGETDERMEGTCAPEGVLESEAVEPITETDYYCSVPVGNFVELDGHVTNVGSIDYPIYYTWDRIDTGAGDYLDKNVPRFAPRRPKIGVTKRYLPNMYILIYERGLFNTTTAEPAPIIKSLEEIEPQANSNKDYKMMFRFFARTRFDNTATATFDNNTPDDVILANAGTFGFSDMTLYYQTNFKPLQIILDVDFVDNESDMLFFGFFNDFRLILFEGGIPDTKVEVLIASVTFDEEEPNPDFDTVPELNWVLVNDPNDVVVSPRDPDEFSGFFLLVAGGFIEPPISIMLRQKAVGLYCESTYFFDITSNLMIEFAPPDQEVSDPGATGHGVKECDDRDCRPPERGVDERPVPGDGGGGRNRYLSRHRAGLLRGNDDQ